MVLHEESCRGIRRKTVHFIIDEQQFESNALIVARWPSPLVGRCGHFFFSDDVVVKRYLPTSSALKGYRPAEVVVLRYLSMGDDGSRGGKQN